MKPALFFGLVLVFIGAKGVHAAAPDAIDGFWRTENAGAIVRILGHAGHYDGYIAWLREARYPPDDPRGIAGRRVTDRHNPDPTKRDRPLIGLRLVRGLHYDVDDNDRATWSGGHVYNVENGKQYHCYVWLADRDHLKLRGYVGIALFGRTTTWTRVHDPRVRIDDPSGAASVPDDEPNRSDRHE